MTEDNREQLTSTESPEGSAEAVCSGKKCAYCKASMPLDARVCGSCSRDQRWYLNYFRVGDLILLVSLLISFGMMGLSYMNFHESQEERVKASQALDRASSAEDLAIEGKKQLEHLRKANEEVAKDMVKIGSLVNEAEHKVKAVDIEVAKSQEAVKRLDATSQFVLAATNAKMGDRKAFDQLWKWSRDNTFPFQNNAVNAWWAIVEDYTQISPYHYQVPWPKTVDPLKLNIDGLRQYYSYLSEVQSRQKAAVIQYVWERPDISKRDKMQFLIDVMNKETNLFPIETAGRYFSKECDLRTSEGLPYKGLLYINFVPWWDKNKKTFK